MSLPEFFIERVASEIHQQMEGVLALTDRLARASLSPDARACVAGVAEAAASVRQILAIGSDLKNAALGGMGFAPEPMRLHDLADDIQERWQARAAAGGVTLLVAYDGDPEATALGDSHRLIQVFNGFIGQALAGVRRGAVEATLRALPVKDDETLLRIEGRVRSAGERGVGDRGGGERVLDIQEIEALFGLETALGVALSREILQALAGEVHSEANRGAGETLVFEFTLPRAAAALADEGQNAASTRAAHILVVDDNATNRMVAETLCEMFDCTSESATDGIEAVQAASTGRFDLILMDIKMPRMDGVSATREIRALQGAAGRVPIIALTANADPDDAAGYLQAGMNGVVEKPMKPETLLHALRENLRGDGTAAAA